MNETQIRRLKQRLYYKDYYEKNREKKIAQAKAYNAAHRDQILSRRRQAALDENGGVKKKRGLANVPYELRARIGRMGGLKAAWMRKQREGHTDEGSFDS